MSQRLLTIFFLLFFLFSAPSLYADPQTNRPGPVPAGHMEAGHMEGMTLQGVVLETINSAGYTYLHLETAQGRIWVAIPEETVQKGAEVIVAPGMTMRHFESKSLGRAFDTIIFSSGLDHEAMAQAITVAAPADKEPQRSLSFA